MMNWQIPCIPALASQLEGPLRRRIDQKTKPPGSLGRLEELALRLGLMQATVEPVLLAPTVLVFAGDHGLTSEGVSPYPSAVTAQMVLNFLSGGAAINVFAAQQGLALRVVDAGVLSELPSHPQLLSCKVRAGTRNALNECALTTEEVELCLIRGEAIAADCSAQGSNALLFGEMGIGNTSAAALLLSALLSLPLSECVGRGTGLDDAGLEKKREVLARVQARHGAALSPLAALAAYGGCEIAMMAGAMIGAAARRMLIVNDGFITTSALVVATRLAPEVMDYAVFSHSSAEAGHQRVLQALGARPLLDLDLRLGEGTGAALVWPLLMAAVNFNKQMATFESAGVSDRGNDSR
ncbi:MAG: nicotinate-nucleotide/dimethylbenzimidazole phosphoribosyltransferase [Pseudomonadota bacterium]|jgi:nicotinate-nucleotide--dimethylbenzimidazole phosphoribosyltransferase